MTEIRGLWRYPQYRSHRGGAPVDLTSIVGLQEPDVINMSPSTLARHIRDYRSDNLQQGAVIVVTGDLKRDKFEHRSLLLYLLLPMFSLY